MERHAHAGARAAGRRRSRSAARPAGGYLPLSLFGIAPIAGVGDDTITNFNVPTFYYGGEPYTRIGVVSNGYVVIGGGNRRGHRLRAADVPEPGAAEQRRRAVLDATSTRPPRRRDPHRHADRRRRHLDRRRLGPVRELRQRDDAHVRDLAPVRHRRRPARSRSRWSTRTGANGRLATPASRRSDGELGRREPRRLEREEHRPRAGRTARVLRRHWRRRPPAGARRSRTTPRARRPGTYKFGRRA